MGMQDGMRNFYGGTVQWGEKAFLIKSGEGTNTSLADKKKLGHFFQTWMGEGTVSQIKITNSVPKPHKTLGWVGG